MGSSCCCCCCFSSSSSAPCIDNASSSSSWDLSNLWLPFFCCCRMNSSNTSELFLGGEKRLGLERLSAGARLRWWCVVERVTATGLATRTAINDTEVVGGRGGRRVVKQGHAVNEARLSAAALRRGGWDERSRGLAAPLWETSELLLSEGWRNEGVEPKRVRVGAENGLWLLIGLSQCVDDLCERVGRGVDDWSPPQSAWGLDAWGQHEWSKYGHILKQDTYR